MRKRSRIRFGTLLLLRTFDLMGCFFNLFVETGFSKKDCETIKDYFVSINQLKTPIETYAIQVDKLAKDFGITVSIKETGYTGLEREGEKEIATAVGYQFFELLKNAPNFRYAMVGVEAGEWVDYQDILDVDFDGYLPSHGIVLSNELAVRIDERFVPFKDGYSWIPYKGEIESKRNDK